MSTKICTCCGGKFTDPKPYQRLCNECADPTKRKKNRTDLKKLHEDIERKKRPIIHSGMTIGQIATLGQADTLQARLWQDTVNVRRV